MMTPNKNRFVTGTALAVSALLTGAMLLSACGKLGALDRAPPMFGDKAKAEWSASSNADGGSTVTMPMSAQTSRATERAAPDYNQKNQMTDPYRSNQKIEDAPLEGFGNATSFNNNNPSSH